MGVAGEANVQRGMVIKAVNREEMGTKTFNEVMDRLRNLPRPLTVSFGYPPEIAEESDGFDGLEVWRQQPCATCITLLSWWRCAWSSVHSSLVALVGGTAPIASQKKAPGQRVEAGENALQVRCTTHLLIMRVVCRRRHRSTLPTGTGRVWAACLGSITTPWTMTSLSGDHHGGCGGLQSISHSTPPIEL